MTARRESRHEQAERVRRRLREARHRRARNDRAAFDGAVAAILHRVSISAAAPSRSDPSPPKPPRRRPAPTTEIFWSNTPVLGYRVWHLKDDRLHGAWTPWQSSRKSAVCLDPHSQATGAVPHDAAVCRPPPCGIYALKGTRRIRREVERALALTQVPSTIALGLVELTGRVVEHESGYRAEHAEAIALALITGAQHTHTVLATIDTRDAVTAVFGAPGRTHSKMASGPMTAAEAVGRAGRFLEEQELAITG